ncbi:MAG: hypothetical protein JWP97_166 [Labilithrix sp.]|nr:hypothetical protein [Labilithrix sp.]
MIPRTTRRLALVTFAGLTLFGQMSAASARESDASPMQVGPAPGANVISINANTQVTIEDSIRIAAYNVRDESYKDDAGKDATRLSAALQISVKNDPSQEQKVRVHAGQTFTAGGKTFEVKSVEKRAVQLLQR